MIPAKAIAALTVVGLIITFIGALLSARGIRFDPPEGAPKPEPGDLNMYIDDGPVKRGLLCVAVGTILQVFAAIPALFA